MKAPGEELYSKSIIVRFPIDG